MPSQIDLFGELAKAPRPRPADAGQISKALAGRLAVQLRRATKAALEATAKAWATDEAIRARMGALPAYLAALTAAQRLPAAHMEAIRHGLDPAVLNEACLQEFDAADYFACVSRARLVEIAYEVIGGDNAADYAAQMSRDEVVERCTGARWLPPELRTAGYGDKPKKKGKR